MAVRHIKAAKKFEKKDKLDKGKKKLHESAKIIS